MSISRAMVGSLTAGLVLAAFGMGQTAFAQGFGGYGMQKYQSGNQFRFGNQGQGYQSHNHGQQYQGFQKQTYTQGGRTIQKLVPNQTGIQNTPRQYEYTQPGYQNTPRQGYGSSQPGYSNQPGLSNYPSGGFNQGNQWLHHDQPHGVSPYNQPGFSNFPSYQQTYAQAPAYTPAVTYSNEPIYIRGCDDYDLSFRLESGSGSWTRTVHAGKVYKCTEDRAWTIVFHRGGEHGYQSYDLRPGLYEFRASQSGWELYRNE